MHYILDGNNIIRHHLWEKDAKHAGDRLGLLVFLENYCRKHPSVKFTVVFDGWADIQWSNPNIKIIWSHDKTADEVIIKKIEALKTNITFVSNDNQIRNRARLYRFNVLKVEEFLDIIDKKVQVKKTSDFENGKKIPYSRVPEIKKELEKYYEKNPETVRKIRKRYQRFF